MSPVIGLLLNILILAALGVTIFYCLRLSRQFDQMRADRKVFETLIQGLNIASGRAEASIKSFKDVAVGNGDILQDKINKSRALVDELEIMIQAGDSLADRLQNLAEKSRRASTDTVSQPEAQSKHPLAAEPRTRAEKELLDALKRSSNHEQNMNPFKKVNIFTFLLVVSCFSFVMRLVDISDFSTQKSVAESTPPPQQFQPVAGQTAAADKPAATTAAAPASADAAKTADKPADQKATDPKMTDQSAAPPPSYGEQGFSASEVEILQDLSKRRDELDKREQQISQREALLKAAGVEVDRKIAELNKIKGELEDLLNKQKTSEDERITSLVKIYENMKPKDAANIFNTLDMNVLLPVIGKISERKASPILAAMDPDKAREVTIKLAEQRKLPQLPDDLKKTKTATPSKP